jgi:hypothetical protein
MAFPESERPGSGAKDEIRADALDERRGRAGAKA